MRPRERAALALLPLLVACGDGPTLTAVRPDHGSARGGDIVTLTGSGFGDAPEVRFGDAVAEVRSASAGTIEVVVPRGLAGAVDVEVVSGADRARRARGFTYEPLPFSFVDAAWARVTPLPVDGAGVALADADGDGDLDALQAARREGVWVYVNDGEGALRARRVPVEDDAGPVDVRFVLAADLDGDGLVDLFLGTAGGAPCRLLRGDGSLGFEAAEGALPELLGEGPSAVAVDLDEDGDLDLVVVGAATAKDAPPAVVVLANHGDGTFVDVTDKRLAGGSFASAGVAVGDLDGDGHLDLFFAGEQGPNRLYLNDGHGTLKLAPPDAVPADPVPGAGIPAIGDLDGDGHADVYLPAAGQDRIYLNDGAGRLADMTDLLLGPEGRAGQLAVIADLDLDGFGDVVVLEPTSGLRLYRNDGTARLFDYSGDVAGLGAGTAGLAVGDLDGDGDADIFLGRDGLSRAALLVSWSPLDPADADADGVPDAVDNCPAVPNADQQNLDSLPFRCASAAQCAAETGCDLLAFESSAYLVCRKAAVGWSAAEAACVARGGHLVTIADAAENTFLTGVGVADLWIGYSDVAAEGTFAWAAGEGSFTSWGTGQPDDAGGDEDCAALLADGTWNDLPCDAARGYVCEDLRVRVPDPGDACDACPSKHEPGSEPVAADAGVCEGAGGAGP